MADEKKAKPKAKLTESELAMLDVLIMRAIEQGKPIIGLYLVEDDIVDQVVNAVENAANKVVDFVTKVVDGFNRSAQAENDLADRALGMDASVLRLEDLNLKEALLKRIVQGHDLGLAGSLTVDELKWARRELRSLAFQKRPTSEEK